MIAKLSQKYSKTKVFLPLLPGKLRDSNIFLFHPQVTRDVEINLRGLGLSLVNNAKRLDLMYIGIASSSEFNLFVIKQPNLLY
jgi:hypothetical protein